MTFVYFIANKRRGLVKIGTSDDPQKRLNALSNGGLDSLHLLAVVPGDERYESALHDRFLDLRVAGEWFRNEGELASLLSLLPSVDTNAAEPGTRRKARERTSISEQRKRELAADHDEHLRLIGDAVRHYGVTAFADEVGADPGDVVRALNQQGRYFRLEWWLHLMLIVPAREREQILGHFLSVIGVGDSLVEEALKTP